MTGGWTRKSFIAAEWFGFLLHWTALFIEAAGVAVIAIGFLSAFMIAIRRQKWAEIYVGFRVSLGRSLILGLAADIIGTVAVRPTLQNLATLVDRRGENFGRR